MLPFKSFERKEKHKGRFDLFGTESLKGTLSLSHFSIGTAWMYGISDLTATGHCLNSINGFDHRIMKVGKTSKIKSNL